MEEDLILNKNKLEQANKDLEEKEKTLAATEAEVASLNRKVQQIEEDLEKSEERSGTAQQKLLEAQQAADENNRWDIFLTSIFVISLHIMYCERKYFTEYTV